MVGKKTGMKKEKRKRKNVVHGWWGKKERKKKRGRAENIQREQRVSEEENEKGRYFGSCEKNK